MSEAKPQLGDLDLELYELTWSEVISMSVQLGMDFAVVRKIDELTSPNIRVLTTMDSWLKSDPTASWNKVVKALKAIKKDVLAQRLEDTHCKTAPAGPSAAVTGPSVNTSTVATPQASAGIYGVSNSYLSIFCYLLSLSPCSSGTPDGNVRSADTGTEQLPLPGPQTGAPSTRRSGHSLPAPQPKGSPSPGPHGVSAASQPRRGLVHRRDCSQKSHCESPSSSNRN